MPGSATRASAYGGTGRSSFGSRLGLHGTLRFALDRKAPVPKLRTRSRDRSYVAVSTSDLQLIAHDYRIELRRGAPAGDFPGRIILGSVYENLFDLRARSGIEL